MLVNKLKELFKKFIYTPHVHDYRFDRKEQTYTSVMDIETRGTVIVYKCKCGALATMEG